MKKIEFTLNRPDGTKRTVGFGINPEDPFRDDAEMQFRKSVGAAQAYFHREFGEAQPIEQISYRVVQE